MDQLRVRRVRIVRSSPITEYISRIRDNVNTISRSSTSQSNQYLIHIYVVVVVVVVVIIII